MNDDSPQYNVAASLNRINRILDSNPTDKFEKKRFIPSEQQLTYENGAYVDCIALSVDIRGSSKLPAVHRKSVLAKIYRSYLSEVVALMKSSSLNRHIRIVGDAVLGIFNAPGPHKQIEEVFKIGVCISDLITILNDRLEKKGYTEIQVGIGIAYGEALMIKAGFYGSGINDIVWMGDVVNTASKIGEEGNKAGSKEYMVCSSVYDQLPQSYKELLSYNQVHACYHASLFHKKTVETYEKIKAARARTSTTSQSSNPLCNMTNPSTHSVSPLPYSFTPSNGLMTPPQSSPNQLYQNELAKILKGYKD